MYVFALQHGGNDVTWKVVPSPWKRLGVRQLERSENRISCNLTVYPAV